jgi:site-specific DNA-methyltransferase (cytosine-N4-specific)
MQIMDKIRQQFSESLPTLFEQDGDSIKFEMKPYLRPFEQYLAVRELKALLTCEDQFFVRDGYHVVKTSLSDEFFKQRLTYWQRLGRQCLEPTVQKALELTQNGLSKTQAQRELHNARRLRYGPHDLHEYRGKFFPQLVRSLINISGVSDSGLVLDPMCGSGTTTCEVLVTGRSAIGVDLNPLSVLIASVKSAIVLESPQNFLDKVSKHLKKFKFKDASPSMLWSKDDLGYLERWFDPEAICDLSKVLADIGQVAEPLYRDFLRVCLSDIVRSVSWQKGTDLRVRKEIKPYEPGCAIKRFVDQVQAQLDRIYAYLCVLPTLPVRPSLTIQHGDAVNVDKLLPEHRGQASLLITSPPYATALPYLDTDRLSLVVLGLLPRMQHKETEAIMVGTREVSERQRQTAWELYLKRRSELPVKVSQLIDQIAMHNHGEDVGFRRRNLPALLGKYFLNMLDAMKSAHAMMADGAYGYYVVGNNSTLVNGQKVEIPTNKFLFEIGEVAGWKPDEMIPMELLVSRDIFKENSGSAETILCFRA